MRTIKELAQEAIDINSAVNLSGLVHGWSKAISELRELSPGAGTETINTHPINVMWADKCRTLAFGREDFCELSERQFSAAYTACKRLAEVA